MHSFIHSVDIYCLPTNVSVIWLDAGEPQVTQELCFHGAYTAISRWKFLLGLEVYATYF